MRCFLWENSAIVHSSGLIRLTHAARRYACALEEKLGSLEASSDANTMKMQQQLVQLHSRHVLELDLKERYHILCLSDWSYS